MMRLLVAGGTGTAGRAVVREAAQRGHEVRVLTHRDTGGDAVAGGGAAVGATVLVHGDLVTGSGLAAALEGVEAVIDVSNTTTLSHRRAGAFFTSGTDHLVHAESRAGVRHHVLVSIVGVDGSRLGYYRAKVDQERRLGSTALPAGVGHTVARVTQFHDFALQTLERSGGRRLLVVPGVQVQPVDVRDVATHVVTLAEGQPTGRAPDLAGPRVERLPDMVRRVAARRGARARVVGVPVPPGLRRALLPDGGLRAAGTFDQWLETLPRPGVTGR
jgi:uncharacterized protein YbjT (DUF2867 family)